MEELKLEKLANNLFEDIRGDKNFFTTKKIIVPSKQMEAYLKTYYLKNYDSVLMNVSFLTFNKAIIEFFGNDKKLANRHQIRSLIIKYLNSNKEIIIDELMRSYLQEPNLAVKLFDLANELTNLFKKFEDDDKIEKLKCQKDIYDYVIDNLNKNNLVTPLSLYESSSSIDEAVYFFGFIKYSECEKKFLACFKNKKEYKLSINNDAETNKVELIKAPSKIREIEYLHSKICEMLLEDNNMLSDFLVVGTNISEYEDVIARVFNQDDVDYPNIPYYINAKSYKNNDVYNALTMFKDIVNKGHFTRLDFDNLINNKIIKFIRGITENDIEKWRDLILELNIYFTKDEWDYAKKRLLVSKIADVSDEDNIVKIEGKDYIPFASIGLDDDSIVRFIEIVDDLNNMLEKYNSSDLVNDKWIEEFKESIDKFLSILDYNSIETNYYYKKVVDIFEHWKNNEIFNIPTRTFLEAIIDAAKVAVSKSGELYTSGISFVEYNNSPLAAKYIFFINASSDNLPIKRTRNALNENEIIYYTDDKNAFNSLYNNCEKMFISYVYRDLINDEEFYLSNFVKDLNDTKIKEIASKNSDDFEKGIQTILIDEDGKTIEKIFTRRGDKNKEYQDILLNKKTGASGKDNVKIEYSNPTEIKVSKLADFLNEPLANKANRLFGRLDDYVKDFSNEYSPFEISNIDYVSIIKEIVIRMLNTEEGHEEQEKNDIIESLKLRNLIPNITEEISDRLIKELFEVYNTLKKELKHEEENGYKWEIIKLPDYSLPNKKTKLVDDIEVIRLSKDNEFKYIPIKNPDKKYNKDLLNIYVISLMDIAKRDVDERYNVILCSDYDKNIFISKQIDHKKAIGILNCIYEYYIAYYEKNNYALDYEWIKDKNNFPDDCYEIKTELNKKSWKYFNEGKLFEFDELGYSENKEEFGNEKEMYLQIQKKLFIFFEKESVGE